MLWHLCVLAYVISLQVILIPEINAFPWVCKGSVSCENEIRDLQVMHEQDNCTEHTADDWATARHAHHQSRRILFLAPGTNLDIFTYHIPDSFPKCKFTKDSIEDPSYTISHYHISLKQSRRTLQPDIGCTDDPDALHFIHIFTFHIITRRSPLFGIFKMTHSMSFLFLLHLRSSLYSINTSVTS